MKPADEPTISHGPYERYGRFPANSGPFRTVLAHQAPGFYDRFYRPEAPAETRRQHQARWHDHLV